MKRNHLTFIACFVWLIMIVVVVIPIPSVKAQGTDPVCFQTSPVNFYSTAPGTDGYRTLDLLNIVGNLDSAVVLFTITNEASDPSALIQFGTVENEEFKVGAALYPGMGLSVVVGKLEQPNLNLKLRSLSPNAVGQYTVSVIPVGSGAAAAEALVKFPVKLGEQLDDQSQPTGVQQTLCFQTSPLSFTNVGVGTDGFRTAPLLGVVGNIDSAVILFTITNESSVSTIEEGSLVDGEFTRAVTLFPGSGTTVVVGGGVPPNTTLSLRSLSGDARGRYTVSVIPAG